VEVGEYSTEFALTTEVADLTGRKTDVLETVQIVQLVPDLIKANELNHNLVLAKCFDVGFLVVFASVLSAAQLVTLLYITWAVLLCFSSSDLLLALIFSIWSYKDFAW